MTEILVRLLIAAYRDAQGARQDQYALVSE